MPGLTEDVYNIIDDFVRGDSRDGMVITFTNRIANLYNELILKKITLNNSLIINFGAKFFINAKVHICPFLEEILTLMKKEEIMKI